MTEGNDYDPIPFGLEEFREYAKNNNVIPVYRKLLGDGETPLNIYKKDFANYTF